MTHTVVVVVVVVVVFLSCLDLVHQQMTAHYSFFVEAL
jgi:hypothetical protein